MASFGPSIANQHGIATLEDFLHNIHLRPIGTIVKMDQCDYPHYEDDMAHNYAHGPSM